MIDDILNRYDTVAVVKIKSKDEVLRDPFYYDARKITPPDNPYYGVNDVMLKYCGEYVTMQKIGYLKGHFRIEGDESRWSFPEYMIDKGFERLAFTFDDLFNEKINF